MLKKTKLKLVNADSPSPIAGNWQPAIKDFLNRMHGDKAPNTERYYANRMRVIARWAGENDIDLDEFEEQHMAAFRAWRADTPFRGKLVGKATLRNYDIAGAKFFAFCKKAKWRPDNPLIEYEKIRAPKKKQSTPSANDVKRLFEAVLDRRDPAVNPGARYVKRARRTYLMVRNYAIITGLVETGARISELLAVKMVDYDRSRKQITLRKTKSGDERIVPLNDPYIEILETYLSWRAPQGATSPYLFVSECDDLIQYPVFRLQFLGDLAFANMPRAFTLHRLRAYSATAHAKKSVLAAQKLLGHKDVRTTMTYLDADDDHVRETHTAAAPLLGLVRETKQKPPRRKLLWKG